MQLDPALHVEDDDRVYRPSEDSHLLLEALEVARGGTFLDVGTGTGLLALHAALRCTTTATDVNPHAVALCRRNARRNGLAVEVLRGDLFAGLRGRFDVVAFNPPYLPGLPSDAWIERAWSGGADSNRVILRFLEAAGAHLTPEGRIYLLLSSHNAASLRRARQLFSVRPLLRRRLFFEEIAAYELRHPPGAAVHKL